MKKIRMCYIINVCSLIVISFFYSERNSPQNIFEFALRNIISVDRSTLVFKQSGCKKHAGEKGDRKSFLAFLDRSHDVMRI
jgi:hypothetical protein